MVHREISARSVTMYLSLTNKEKDMRKHIAAATVAVASIAGFGTAFMIGVPGLAGAEPSASTTTVAPGTSAPEDTLAKLVADGTITQAQADSVEKALTDAHKDGKGKGGHKGKRGELKGRFKDPKFIMNHANKAVTAAATALGMPKGDVLAAILDGSTIAKLAEQKNVPLNTVVTAVVTELSTTVDQAVTDGNLTADEGTSLKAMLPALVTEMANGRLPFPGPGGDHDGPDAPAPAPEVTTTVK
jgi:polyhydroxyalkanoate synthesis regulator phasin